MTIFEAIAELAKYDPNLQVHVKISNTGRTEPVEAIFDGSEYDEYDGKPLIEKVVIA